MDGSFNPNRHSNASKRRRTSTEKATTKNPPTTAKDLLPSELRRKVLTFLPYPELRESRTVSIFSSDFPQLANQIVLADRGRQNTVDRLVLTDVWGIRTLTPENSHALDVLLDIPPLKTLVLRLHYIPASLVEKINRVLPRLTGLDLGNGNEIWLDCNTNLMTSFCNRLRRAHQLEKLCVGSLTVCNDGNVDATKAAAVEGRAEILDALAEAIQDMHWLSYLRLSIIPADTWRFRMPCASHIHLEISEYCNQNHINWIWYLSGNEGARRCLSVSGYVTLDTVYDYYGYNNIYLTQQRPIRIDFHEKEIEASDFSKPENIQAVATLCLPFREIHVCFRATADPSSYFPTKQFLKQFIRIWDFLDGLKTYMLYRRDYKYEIVVPDMHTRNGGFEEDVIITATALAWLILLTIEKMVDHEDGEIGLAYFSMWNYHRVVVRVPTEHVDTLAVAMRKVQFRPNWKTEEILERGYLKIKALKPDEV